MDKHKNPASMMVHFNFFTFLLLHIFTDLLYVSLALEIPSNSNTTFSICFIVLDRVTVTVSVVLLHCVCVGPSLTLGSAGLAWPDSANPGIDALSPLY